MLEKSLDVLRNKELTFGCVVERGYWINKGKDYPNDVLVMVEEKGYYGNSLEYPRISSDNYSHNNIIGHPLTRGRIEHLVDTENKEHIKTKNEIYFYLFDYGMLDKTELERMQSDKRNELYPLLVEFSSYLSK